MAKEIQKNKKSLVENLMLNSNEITILKYLKIYELEIEAHQNSYKMFKNSFYSKSLSCTISIKIGELSLIMIKNKFTHLSPSNLILSPASVLTLVDPFCWETAANLFCSGAVFFTVGGITGFPLRGIPSGVVDLLLLSDLEHTHSYEANYVS